MESMAEPGSRRASLEPVIDGSGCTMGVVGGGFGPRIIGGVIGGALGDVVHQLLNQLLLLLKKIY